ncbi:hypothetical protein [Flagellimonas iocasae]|uniref:DUF4625 domain-containing protein n=1 Tax=Flagellimonas iocasae TaxID=2055905 RepID=A0ABW4XWJ8_9FLAO
MRTILILFCVILLTGCSNDDEVNEVNIRLSNVSDFNFENIVINTSTGMVNFEDIISGEQTDYKTFEKAYRYAFVELEIDGETYTLQPFDYVGEEPLKNGNYTYQIDADVTQEQYGSLSLTLVED